MKWIAIGFAVLAALAVLVLLAGRLGWLSGAAPARLGVHQGRLEPPSKTPNSVSSQARLWGKAAGYDASIAPLPLHGDGVATLARIRTLVESMPGARVVESRPDYLYVQFTTRWLRFVDDAEFWYDPTNQVVQVRSASRVGRKDFGVNRARIEAIRARLAGP